MFLYPCSCSILRKHSNLKNATRQVGRITFHTRSDSSHLVIVALESQAKAMLTLKYLDGKPFPVFPDTQLNAYTGTALIHHKICLVVVNWSDCSSELFELIADKHDIAHVSYFTINPRGCHKYSANITFKGQDLPDYT